QRDGPGTRADRLGDVDGVPGAFAHGVAVQIVLDAPAIGVVDAVGVADGENHDDLAHAGGGAGQELGQHQVGPGGDGEVRTQIEAPAQLVLQIAGRVVLFGVEAAPARDVDRQGVTATVIGCGLDGEVAPARGGGEEVGIGAGGKRAGAVAVEVVGKEDRARVRAGGRDVVDVEVA